MRIDRDEWLLQMAELVALRGTCSRYQVGVVIAREGRVLATGYNGAPAGLPHCEHECTCTPNDQFGVHAADCEARPGCTVAVHAEANAIAYAARLGIALEGASLYCSLSPCVACAQLIINAGVRRVFFRSCYRITDALALFDEVAIEYKQLELE